MSSFLPDTDPAASAALQRQLAPGEQVLWQGQPRQGWRLHRADALAIPFSLFWGGFAIFWEWQVLHSGAPAFFALWGIPFVLVGLYLIVGRFAWDARRRAQTRYVLTTERVLILSGSDFRRVVSVPLRPLSNVVLDEASDGSGTIQLGGASAGWASMGWNIGWMPPSWPGAARRTPQLEAIADAQRVFQHIRAAQLRAA